jgi:hypothetical protein
MKETPWLKINCYSAYYLHKLTSDKTLDFLMVQSSRNEPFDLFVNEVSSLLNLMLKNPGREIYAYRIKCTDHILKIPVIDKKTSEFLWLNSNNNKLKHHIRQGNYSYQHRLVQPR